MKRLLFIALAFAFIATSVRAALSVATVWEVRAGGNNLNGGGFVAGASGVDYSLQDAPQYSFTDLAVADGDADPGVVTSASHSFDANDVGNIIRINAGTNWTVGHYTIVSVGSGAATLDRPVSATDGALTGGTWREGGAKAAIGDVGSATAGLGAVAGNIIYVKAGGTYAIGASDTLAASGSSTIPIIVRGYNSTRGDAFQGYNADRTLITTNMPAYAYSAGFKLNATGLWLQIEGINFSSTVSSRMIDIGADALVRFCKMENASTNASAAVIELAGNRTTLMGCEISMTGASGGTFAVSSGTSGDVRIIGNRIKGGTATRAVNVGAGSATFVGNIIFDSTGVGVGVTSTTGRISFYGNTIVGCGGDAIDIITGSTVSQMIFGNHITDNTGYAIDMVAAGNAAVVMFNRLRDNTAGGINSGTGWVDASNYGGVTTDTGGPETDYVNAGADDYRLISTAPGKGVGFPAFMDIGALQREEPAGGGGEHSYIFAQ